MDTDPDKQWLRDKINEDFLQLYRLDEVLYEGRTRYQSVRIVRTRTFGLCLVLDGKIQSSERDEFIYHEALVQPAMITHPGPETVFIAGGGEGAALRETLAYKSVKKVVMAEIDTEVTTLSQQYLPDLSRGAFEDKRTDLRHVDARNYLEKTKDKFDIIIIDLPDPIEKGPAYLLFTREFYQIVLARLTENGLIAVQAGSASPTDLLNLTAVNNTLRSVFPFIVTYTAYVPCFGGPWGFCLASRQIDPSCFSPVEVDKRIIARSLGHLRFYDGITHRSMFSLPAYIRQALISQKRLITDKEPLYLYGK
jgi:spermidine synthase